MDLSKWPIVNWVAFLATVVINYFASGDNAAVSDRIDIYFKPAGYAFSIWGVIYVALLVWLVLQLKKGTTANRQAERMKAGFLVSCVLNGLWLLAFTNEWFVVSLVIMVLFLATLCWLYYIAFRTSTSWLDRFLFSIYIGWVSVATIVNTFVVFLSRIAAWIASRFVSREELVPIVHFIAVIVFQIIFSILGSLVVFAYSRHREFHADRGGADLAGKDKMIHALRSLEAYTSRIKDDDQAAVATLKISGKRKASLFSTHPDLNERIRRLEAK